MVPLLKSVKVSSRTPDESIPAHSRTVSHRIRLVPQMQLDGTFIDIEKVVSIFDVQNVISRVSVCSVAFIGG